MKRGRKTVGKTLTTAIMAAISVIYLSPIFIVFLNSFKQKTAISASPFSFPRGADFVGFANYIRGIEFGDYPFLLSAMYSVFITVGATMAILLFTSMTAWYITRVDNKVCRGIYYLCVFSMIVPFQMVMYTLSKTADTLQLNNPFGIIVIYLGFGAGLAVFMFCGFVKSIPLAIEEAANIDGCGPVRTFFGIVLPIMKPTLISVAILEAMWIWNDYLLPYLVLDIKNYRTIPIHIQYLNGSYGQVDLGAIMALIVLSIIPIIIFYFTCQKHIIKGIMAGAVKG